MLDNPEIEKTCPMCNEDISQIDIQYLGEGKVSELKRAPPPKEEKKEEK